MIYVETDKAKAISHGLLNPHYNNERFRKGQTVFLAPGHTTAMHYGVPMVDGVSYDYSDRLQQWHGKKCNEAWKVAEEKGFEKNSAQLIEAYLQELLEDPSLELVHVIAGVNVGNGYPYQVYGYISGKKED